ncbi:related to HOL1-Putative substrate-H+ antiporter-unknown biological function [Fusarium fujikuroi IMI 58289]|uniref:Major facilitator superfamily (MFS) profile domain-containing protein n=1 Tax=Gibberella fujikuroi (strain CBS 195.34 / IMI 58289 / NRRL A-6831) TaxID=1279085 RepID=S0EEM7_GIBF5|nr:LOW QUALITY PROTEIN: putative HOL1-like protein [Fusarium fujikuroi IMI 58289]CCT73115.1 related to HOL1-Putative substrate-H+ antiporter-unknown biological function [Fusarium fujikuroi IMI 58289]
MSRKVAPAPPDFTTPPGTVRLIGEDGIAETPQLVKQPMPTDDPNDPLNWSRARKSMNFIPILAVTVIIFTHELPCLSTKLRATNHDRTSLPLIFWVLWNQEFGWSYGQLNNANALNYVGTTVGSVKYGRRSMYLLTTAIIFAMAIWSARMKTLTELYISQLIFGLASATNESIVEMTDHTDWRQIADLYFVHQRGSANGLYMVMVMIGSFLSPVIAGYMAANGNWRLCYWITTAVDGALLLYFCFFFEESKYIPHLEAQQLSSEVPTPIAVTKKDNISETQTGEMSTCVTLEPSNAPLHRINSDIPLLTWRQRMRLVTKTDESLLGIVRTAVVILFRFPAVMYTALTYAFCLCWISAQASIISIVFTQPPYNFGTVGVGNMSLGVFIGCILGSAYGAISDRAILWFTRKNYGYYEPEMRLQLNHFPAVCMSGGFVMFGITAAKGMHWIYPSIGSAIFGFGLGGLSDVALCVTIDSYQAITGEAFIGVAFMRNAFSIAISFALVPWLDAQGLQNMTIVMGLWALAMAFLHVPMMIWGKRIREKTETSYKRMATGTRV